MDKKIPVIIVINVIFFLLFLKFGSVFIWFLAAAGVGGAFIFAISIGVIGAYAPDFYVQKLSPFCKSIIGSHLPDLEDEPEEAKRKAKLVLIGLSFMAVFIAFVIYLVKRFLL